MKAHFLPDDKIISLKPGRTLLNSALNAKIPLAHACGGIGRCSTCRVWVLEGENELPPADEAELETAKRLGLEDRVRLACRLIPTGDIKVRRLTLDEDVDRLRTPKKEKPGEELELVVLFSDLRNFTPFAESLPPHDVIFILDRFFSQMGKVISEHGGVIQNYMGDGFLALFGQDYDINAPGNSVRAAIQMRSLMEDFSYFLKANFNKTIKMGLGLHWGKVVIGTMGYGNSRRLTVIGDTVNTASRIESTTKSAGVDILLSQELYHKVKESVVVNQEFLVELKGKSGKAKLYELTGLTDNQQEMNEGFKDAQGRLFFRACRQNEVISGTPFPVLIQGEKRLLIVTQGKAYAIEDRCPHMRLPLQGAKVTSDGGIQCPWHHSAFDLETGEIKEWAPWPPVVGPILGAIRKKRLLQTWPVMLKDKHYWVAEKQVEDD